MRIAVTGHRPDPKLGGYKNQPAVDWFARRAIVQVRKKHPQATVITGMALGWDQAVARACVDERVPFLAYVSFKGQESAWPPNSQSEYHRLLKHAQEVKTVCEGGYEAKKLQKRNEAMVDDCDMLLALYDGSTGGTANCIRYAETKGKRVVNLWQKWKTSTWGK